MKARRSRLREAGIFLLMVLGSLFVQCFFWAMYSLLELRTAFCVMPALLSALFYHFLQIDRESPLSRGKIFLASVLIPFLLSGVLSAALLLLHPNLTLLSAALDGVSPFTEMMALYSARLFLNGLFLMLFAAADAFYLRKHPRKERKNET